ncbi:MAG: hypothetical protein WBI17_07015 [Clostridiaceae bacterium]
MNKKVFKEELISLFSQDVDGISLDDKFSLARGVLFTLEKEQEHNEKNKGKEWTDEELKVVLSFSPNKENCLKLARAFNRGYGSIEQIYRWAATSDKSLEEKGRYEDKFVLQIKRVAKECGWRI